MAWLVWIIWTQEYDGGQVRSVVDITARRLGNLQAKWCVRPVNGVRVHLNVMGNVVEET
jgi:hypothetical protein